MKLENAKVTITLEDPNELIEAMDSQEKMDFFQSLSCHDEIIEHVMCQVFDGWTENGSHGSISCTWNGSTPLQKFKAKMIEIGATKEANRRIKDLEMYMGIAKEEIEDLKEETRKLSRKLLSKQ